MAGSFIGAVKNVAKKLDIIESANTTFDPGVIPVLEEIALLDLDLAIADLKKGTFFGNRKIDIDLALNNKVIYDYIQSQTLLGAKPDANVMLDMWTTVNTAIYYKGATILYVDGNIVEIVFKDQTLTNAESVASSSEVISHIEQDLAYIAYTTETSMIQDNDGIVGQIIRAYDIVGTTSNLERITLHVDEAQGGVSIDISPTFYWGKTTSAFETLSMRTADIIKLGNDIDSIITLANRITEMLDLQSHIPEFVTNLDSLYANIAKLQAIYTNITGITTVYNDIKVGGTNYINSAATDLQLGASSKILTISADLQLGLLSKIKVVNDSIIGVNTVSASIANVNTTAINIANVNTTAASIANVNLVGGSILNVNTTAGAIANVNITATNIADVNTTALNITNVNAVGVNILNVLAVNTNAGNINAVNANKINIDLNATNIVAIQNASTNAATATTQAGISTAQAVIATAQAGIATTKANEIKAITAGTTTTGAAGTNALVTFDSVTSKFYFVVPQGIKGDRGDAFQVNSVGLLADKSLYDSQVKGFSFLAIDTAGIYFKLSNTVADWSVAAPFGKGDVGATGATGVGVVSTIRTSGTGLAGSLDTYTITYTDASTDTLTVQNGLNGVLINDATMTLISTWSSSKIVSALSFKEDITANDIKLASKSNIADIQDILTSIDATKPLSARQGSVLKGMIDNLITLVGSNDVNLDTLQEIVTFIKLNKTTLDALAVANIIGLSDALLLKADKLTTYTKTEVDTIIAGIQTKPSTAQVMAYIN